MTDPFLDTEPAMGLEPMTGGLRNLPRPSAESPHREVSVGFRGGAARWVPPSTPISVAVAVDRLSA